MKTHNRYLSYTVNLLIFCFLSSIVQSQDSDFGIIPDKDYFWFKNDSSQELKVYASPLVEVPPVCGKKRRQLGHDLALPFGTGASFFYYNQYYLANDLQLTNDTIGITAIGEANVQNSTSSEMRLTFRPDVWVLPFLNVYGIIGYSQSTTSPNFEVPQVTIKDIPNIGDIVIDTVVSIDDELVYYGPTYGGGVTISSGFNSYFFILDYHYSVTKPKDLEDKIKSHNFSGKIGLLLGKNHQKIKGAFWLGTMYINDNHRFTGEVNVKDILPELEAIFGEKATYSGTVNARQYWNLLIGGSLMVNKHHLIALELGYFKREQVSLTYGFRF